VRLFLLFREFVLNERNLNLNISLMIWPINVKMFTLLWCGPIIRNLIVNNRLSHHFLFSFQTPLFLNMKPNTRKFLLSASCITTIILAILVVAAYFIIPVFTEMFSSFGGELPSTTQFVIATYKYWLIIPIITLAICIDVWRRSEYTGRYRTLVSYTLLGFVVGTIFLVVFVSIFAMYAPIFTMGNGI